MSRMPQVPAPDASLLRSTRAPLFDLDVSVVTPLFGGGATAGAADPLVPVRAASVRGHLRFWWRACKSAAYESVDTLFEAEEKMWGSTTIPSPIIIRVDVDPLSPGSSTPCATFVENLKRPGTLRPTPNWGRFEPYSYALFPFQGKLADNKREVAEKPANAIEGVRFRLRVDIAPGVDTSVHEELRVEAEAALWAWFTFGGIGARTRRGCGSLYCGAAPFAPPRQITEGQLGAWLREMATQHLALAPRRLPIPALHGASLYTGRSPIRTLQSWSQAVNLMRDFRQKPDLGRNPGQQPNRPGRSRWPEADSIRRATGVADPLHHPTHPAGNYYPRADLGLPIVFHYQSRQDPRDTVLQIHVDGMTRMASPIILKPLALSEQESVPLVMCLNAPHVWDGKTPVHVSATRDDLRKDELIDVSKSAQVSPLNENKDEYSAGTAREAFMHYARQTLHSAEIQL